MHAVFDAFGRTLVAEALGETAHNLAPFFDGSQEQSSGVGGDVTAVEYCDEFTPPWGFG
jgi:hypothetical protein